MKQRKQPKPFSTSHGRIQLYTTWIAQQVAAHRLQTETPYTLQERCSFFASWLRWCIKEGHLDPHSRLPPYDELALLPFDLETQDVAQIIVELRAEHFLPARKRRKDANRPQWTPRDYTSLAYIGHMHGLRFDQLQRLLARTSPSPQVALSLSRTWEVVDRWVQAKLAVYERPFYEQPGWVFLTRKGLHLVGLPFRAEAPSIRTLEHLYWINEVRLQLEQEHPEMQWRSERSLQAGKQMREAGQHRKHLPDGILVLPSGHGETVEIEIEVQISKPSPQEVSQIMAADEFWTETAPLRYYVNRLSQGVVRGVYHRLQDEGSSLRPSLEIIDLEHWCSSQW